MFRICYMGLECYHGIVHFLTPTVLQKCALVDLIFYSLNQSISAHGFINVLGRIFQLPIIGFAHVEDILKISCLYNNGYHI